MSEAMKTYADSLRWDGHFKALCDEYGNIILTAETEQQAREEMSRWDSFEGIGD